MTSDIDIATHDAPPAELDDRGEAPIPHESAPAKDTAEDASLGAFRQMPHNEEAEQALIGALLVDNQQLERVSEFLKPEHFYVPVHGRIYEAIAKLCDRGQVASPVTLKNYFEGDTDLSLAGGADYLVQLANNVVSVVNTIDYARTVHELHLRRELIEIGETVVLDASRHDLEVTPLEQIEDAEKKLFDLATTGDAQGGFISLKVGVTEAIRVAEKAFKSDSHVTGVTSGLRDMDAKLGGLHGSDLLILAGRPSMGKTALAVNIGFNAARRYLETDGREGGKVGLYSLEMSADQLATRILSQLAEVSGDKIRRGEVSERDFKKFVEASQLMSQVPLYIDDTPALSIGAVRTRARRLKRQEGLDMIIVDYLQLLRGSGSKQGNESRVQEVSEITRGLKALAKELQVPVLALSQLSRAVEQREDKRPQLSDLRESGSIEQDADVVMFVFREQYYLERALPAQRPEEAADKFNERFARWQERCEKAHNVAECIVAKQRHGPVGTVKLFFDGNYTRFGDLDIHHDDDLD